MDDLVMDASIKTFINNYLVKKTIPNILLSGIQGIGKTTFGKIIIKSLESNSIYVDSSVDSGIDMVRTRIVDFCNAVAMNAEVPKIVFIDEFDGNKIDAQKSLKGIIETASDDTRFILATNHPNNVLDAIKSRCTPIALSFSVSDVTRKVVDILQKEKVVFDKIILKQFIEQIVMKKFPDIRDILQNLEFWSITGTLTPALSSISGHAEIIQKIKDTAKARDVRKYLIENETLFSRDYIGLASELFNAVETEHEMEIIGEYIYRMHNVTDIEIQFSCMVSALKNHK
jgi:DNA polymerase III delta prime subunit